MLIRYFIRPNFQVGKEDTFVFIQKGDDFKDVLASIEKRFYCS